MTALLPAVTAGSPFPPEKRLIRVWSQVLIFMSGIAISVDSLLSLVP